MEDFNLDTLQKTTPYKVPESFWENLQEEVIQKTQPQKQFFFKITYLKRTIYAAASLLLILGAAYFWKTSLQSEAFPSPRQQEVVSLAPPSFKNEKQKPAIKKEIQERKFVADNPLKYTPENRALALHEEEYKQLINALSDEEINALSEHLEQDIYLELYN